MVADCIDVVVNAPNVHDAVNDGRGRENLPMGRVIPELVSVVGIESVDVVVGISTRRIDDTIGDGGRHRSASSCVVPEFRPVVSVDGIDFLAAPYIHHVIDDGRRGVPISITQPALPELVPVVGIEGKEGAARLIAPHIDDAVNDGGG